MPFNFFKSKNNIDYKARLERKMCLAKEAPEPIFDLSDCNLNSIPSGVYLLCKVLRKEALFLHENILTTLTNSSALRDLNIIKVLDLHSNKISKLPEEIGCLENLENLNLRDNQLASLPDAIGNLNKLKTLNVSENKLKVVPASLGRCKSLLHLDLRENPQLLELPSDLGNLVNLMELLLDKTVQYSPKEVYLNEAAAEEILLEQKQLSKEQSLKQSTDYFLLQERLKMLEQRKDVEKNQRLERERALYENSQKEFLMQEELKGGRKKLIDEIKVMQNSLQEELQKIQARKDMERNELIRQCLEVEEGMNNKVCLILENAKKFQKQINHMSEKEKAMEEQLLYQINAKTQSVEKSRILDGMNELVQEELVKAEQWQHYQVQKREATVQWINQESELTGKLADLAQQASKNSHELTRALLANEELQKAAVASLMEQSDTRSWNLAQQVASVGRQLAELTQVELTRKKIAQEGQIVELSASRIALTELLLDLFAQQEQRRSQLVSALLRMEGNRDSDDFWLEQYQRLLTSTSHQLVQSLKAVDTKLYQELAFHGVIHLLPLIVERVCSRDSISSLRDKELRELGITEEDDRVLMLKALKNYLEGNSALPSAPSIAEEPSAPPLSPTESVTFTSVTLRSEDECVVCLSNKVEVIFIPCGHMCCCASCANLSQCPLCRTTVDRLLHSPWAK